MKTLELAGPGTLIRHHVPRGHGKARTVDVWLPPDDGAPIPSGGRPVVYALDGQNLFRPEDSFFGRTWHLAEAGLVATRRTGVPMPILVGIWNAHGVTKRRAEYLPPEPPMRPYGSGVDHLAALERTGRARAADVFVSWLVGSVIPLVEGEYPVARLPRGRTVLGSSTAAIGALYAAVTRPDVFGAVGCLSTHWVLGGDPLVDWFAPRVAAGRLRMWFDHGTEDLDGEYGPAQERLDAALRASPLVQGRDWITRVYPGTGHSEDPWAARVADVLSFLLPAR